MDIRYRLTRKPQRVRRVNDIIAAMWGVLSESQLSVFGAQCALWLRSSLHLLSSLECHTWFAIVRSISSTRSTHDLHTVYLY